MTKDEKTKIVKAIIALIDNNLKRSKVLISSFNGATKGQKRKIIRDVINYYIDIQYVPEKVEGFVIEKAVSVVMDYLERR